MMNNCSDIFGGGEGTSGLARGQDANRQRRGFCYVNNYSQKRTYCLNVLTSKKCAFTIAEVLITLGIIGIVAAMTLPVLLSKYQSKANATAFKKQYAVLTDTIAYLSLEENLNKCYIYYAADTETGVGYYGKVNEDCDALYAGIVQKLNLTPVENDFGDIYKADTDVISGGGKSINATVKYLDSVRRSKAYLTKDGAIYFFDSNVMYMSLDTNGYKGPNKWGYDVFFMALTSNNLSNRIILSDGPASIVDKGGCLPRTILQNKEDKCDANQDFTGKWY